MQVLVLGGSGLIGNAIVRRLVSDGHRVTAAGRKPTRPLNLEGLEVAYVVGDAGNAEQLDTWIADHDVVVDAAAPYALNLFHAPTPRDRSPVEHAAARTDALLRSVARHGAVLVYVGTPKRFLANDHAGIRSQFAHSLQPYFEVKRVIEERVLEAAGRGLPTLFLRPSASFGPWDIKPREQCWLPALVSGEIPLVLQHRVNVVDTRDVADALASSLRRREYGRDIPINGHNTSVADLFSVVCSSAGVAAPRWSVPAAAGILPALWAELAWALVGRPSPLPSLVLMLLCEQDWEAPAGERPSALRPLSDTARDALAWYRSLGYCL
jgi:dihydroflavonol-4-reductase